MSQFEFPLTGDHNIDPAGAAPENIVPASTADRRQRRSSFFLDPATGALEIRPDAGAVIEKALMRELNRIKLRIYLRFAFLYFEKFGLQCRAWALHQARLISRLFG
jgi:hypothetical protein